MMSRNFSVFDHWFVISTHFTVWKLRKFTLTLFWQNFRETNIFLKKLLNRWFDEIFFGESKFLSQRVHFYQFPDIFFFRENTYNVIKSCWFDGNNGFFLLLNLISFRGEKSWQQYFSICFAFINILVFGRFANVWSKPKL